MRRRAAAITAVFWTMAALAHALEQVGFVENDNVRLEPLKKLASSVEPDATVRFYFVEKLLATWNMGGKSFNGYHSGLGIEVGDDHFTLDFYPENPSDLTSMFVAKIEPVYPRWMPNIVGRAYAWIAATYTFTWSNRAKLDCNVRGATWGDNNTATYIGSSAAGGASQALTSLHAWASKWAQETGAAFSPLQMDVESNSSMNVAGSMCHDFFEDAYHFIVTSGAMSDVEKEHMLFRDAVVMFTSKVETVKRPFDWRTRREMARYYTFFGRYMGNINSDFTVYRKVAKSLAFTLIPVFRHRNGEYYRATFTYPFVNYCYLRIPVPPERSRYFAYDDDQRACMLSMAYEFSFQKPFRISLRSLASRRYTYSWTYSSTSS